MFKDLEVFFEDFKCTNDFVLNYEIKESQCAGRIEIDLQLDHDLYIAEQFLDYDINKDLQRLLYHKIPYGIEIFVNVSLISPLEYIDTVVILDEGNN